MRAVVDKYMQDDLHERNCLEESKEFRSTFVVSVCWGSFDSFGIWSANPILNLSTDEQYNQNVKNGFLTHSYRKH